MLRLPRHLGDPTLDVGLGAEAGGIFDASFHCPTLQSFPGVLGLAVVDVVRVLGEELATDPHLLPDVMSGVSTSAQGEGGRGQES